MATVVRLGRDTRAEELGQGISTFLERMRDGRLDRLQTEMMGEISAAGDEATASAIFGDRKYTAVTGDPVRMAAMTTHYNNAPLGWETIIGYHADGTQEAFSYRESEKPEDVLKRNNATLERLDLKYIIDETNPFDPGRLVGSFRSNAEALDALDEPPSEGQRVLGSLAFDRLGTARERSQNAQIRQAKQVLSEIMANFNMEKPLTAFDSLIRAYDNGKGVMTEKQFDQAWKFITERVGRTGLDLAESTKADVGEQGALIQAMSRGAFQLSEMAIEDPTALAKTGAVPRFFNAITAELEAIGVGLGITVKDVESYDWDKYSGRSTAFKNMVLSFAVLWAASEGQTGRALSNEEFDRFFSVVGGGINDPIVFVRNLQAQVQFKQENFNVYHSLMQNGLTWEQAAGQQWIRFDADKESRDAAEIAGMEETWKVDLDGKPTPARIDTLR